MRNWIHDKFGRNRVRTPRPAVPVPVVPAHVRPAEPTTARVSTPYGTNIWYSSTITYRHTTDYQILPTYWHDYPDPVPEKLRLPCGA